MRDPTRTLLTMLVIGALIACSLWVVRPFLSATIWAVTIVVTTWPLLLRIQGILWGRRSLAVILTTLVILVVFVVPFWLATSTILTHREDLAHLAQSAATLRIPAPPHWVQQLPLVGVGVQHFWTQLQDAGLSQLAPRIAPYAGLLTRWFIGLIGGFGVLVVQFLMTIIIAAIIHANGEAASKLVMRLGTRLGGEHGRGLMLLAGRSIRAVAIGVMVTALVQCLVGGLGLKLAGVPLAGVLTAVMFVFCLAQAGPGFVLIPAVIWAYMYRDFVPATGLLITSLAAITIDNVLRPYLIRREADLPTLLVLAGVLGGLSAFGLVGIFVGPVILAVSYTMLQAWLAEGERAGGSTVIQAEPSERAAKTIAE